MDPTSTLYFNAPLSVPIQYQPKELSDFLSPDDLIRLSGAPNNSEITFSELRSNQDEVFYKIEVKNPTLFDGFVVRYLLKEGDVFVIENKRLYVNASAANNRLGARVVAREIVTAVQLNQPEQVFLGIKATAAGNYSMLSAPPGQQEAGYYVWASMGFQGNLAKRVRKRLPANFQNCVNIQQLIASPGGSAAWKLAGETFKAWFDLAAGSPSLSALDSYMQKNGISL